MRILKLFVPIVLFIVAVAIYQHYTSTELNPETTTHGQAQPETRLGPPLPSGAVIEEPGAVAVQKDDSFPLAVEGSLRPDDRKPAQRVGTIIKRGRLIAGVDQSNNLMSYRDTITGEMRGFEVDLAHEIARDIFGDPSKVEFRFVDSSDRVSALNNREVDVVIRSMSVTGRRQTEVEFSLPYMISQTRMLVETRSGIEDFGDLEAKTVCATRGSTSAQWIRKSAPQARILTTRSWGDCLMAMQLGQVDAIITDDALLSGMLAQDPYTQIVGEPISTETYAVAVRKPSQSDDTTGLVRQVNSTLERVRADGTYDRLFDQWLGTYLPRPQLPEPYYRDEPSTSKGQTND